MFVSALVNMAVSIWVNDIKRRPLGRKTFFNFGDFLYVAQNSYLAYICFILTMFTVVLNVHVQYQASS